MEHAKGPWAYTAGNYQPLGYPYAIIRHRDDGPNDVIAPNVDTEANAKLIAAAPEMLAALEDVESKIVDYVAGRINWRPDDFLHRVRAAIKAARGQA